ncbi:HNH endonuclease [Aspergillus candidus]|uniref:HNH domain-containing protein n=1 Tax=Aspergillus candidus TaxID=41067 RepID=A0A2I2F7H2_ASPCN|nr:hypothetical protein BDW47DRAFT_132746 [Aspergillus candidus]PLB36563.1 hypothetical protein BDW47DRAFT_132746 [Aspergillus candidus]
MTTLDPSDSNYQVFRECLSSAIVERSTPHRPQKAPKRRAPKTKRNGRRDDSTHKDTVETKPAGASAGANPEELAEFIDFLASEIFPNLPDSLKTLTYSTLQHDAALSTQYETPLSATTRDDLTAPLPATVSETLTVYGLAHDVPDFLGRVLNEYIEGATKPPPVWASTRTDACEICERDWIPLSYHHLIPRGVHAKVLKKGWHDEWMLNSVAWLCRACHSFVHRMAGNEELAREWFTVERILEREDVRAWARWVGRVRWKAT